MYRPTTLHLLRTLRALRRYQAEAAVALRPFLLSWTVVEADPAAAKAAAERYEAAALAATSYGYTVAARIVRSEPRFRFYMIETAERYAQARTTARRVLSAL